MESNSIIVFDLLTLAITSIKTLGIKPYTQILSDGKWRRNARVDRTNCARMICWYIGKSQKVRYIRKGVRRGGDGAIFRCTALQKHGTTKAGNQNQVRFEQN